MNQAKPTDLTVTHAEYIKPSPLDNESPVHLPLRDGGREAWTLLAAVSLIYGMTGGFECCFSVFREYYWNHGLTQGDHLVVSAGPMSLGLLQIIPFFLLQYLNRRPRQRKPMLWTGAAICSVASFGAAFSQTSIQIMMTLGILYGVGSGLLMAPSVSFIDEWFLERRGLANGIFFGFSNIFTAVLSPAISILLKHHGPRIALISWGVVVGITMSLCIILIKPRLQSCDDPEPTSLRQFKKPIFWLFALSITLQGLAAFLPGMYLPSYATDLGLSPEHAAVLITFLSISATIGLMGIGWLADKVGTLTPLLLCSLVSAFSIFVLWGLGQQYWAMVLLSIVFGAFAYGFVVLRSHMAAVIVRDRSRAQDELLVSGALIAVRGVATVVSGYMGAAVLSAVEHVGIQPGYGAGKWRSLIILLGALSLSSAIAVVGFVGKRSKVEKGESDDDLAQLEK